MVGGDPEIFIVISESSLSLLVQCMGMNKTTQETTQITPKNDRGHLMPR